ncbi:MAG: hypothetical protein AAF709_22410, partial [Pseudomonadota bacterium]
MFDNVAHDFERARAAAERPTMSNQTDLDGDASSGVTDAYDVAVVGGGPVGLTIALNIAKRAPTARIALIAPQATWVADRGVATPDLRTAALFHESLA